MTNSCILVTKPEGRRHFGDFGVDKRILSRFRGEYRRCMDLLTTYTHHSELHVTTALSLISTLYRSSQHPLSLLPVCCVFISRSWQRLLTVEILQLHEFRFHLHSVPCRTVSNSNSIVLCVFVATGMCLPIRCLETGCITPLFIRLLRSNGCTRHNIIKICRK
jgi:hypothetical protein